MGWRSAGAAYRAGTYRGPLTSGDGGFAIGFAQTFVPGIQSAIDNINQNRRDEREHERSLERIRLQETLRTTRAASGRSSTATRAAQNQAEWIEGAMTQYGIPATPGNIAVLAGIYEAEGSAVQAGNALQQGMGSIYVFEEAPDNTATPTVTPEVVEPASVVVPSVDVPSATPVQTSASAPVDDLEATEPTVQNAVATPDDGVTAQPAVFNPDDTNLQPTLVSAEEAVPAEQTAEDGDNIIQLGGDGVPETLAANQINRAVRANVVDYSATELQIASTLAVRGEDATPHDQAVLLAQRSADVRAMQGMGVEQLQRIAETDDDEWRRTAAQQMLDVPQRLDIPALLTGVTTRAEVVNRMAILQADTDHSEVEVATALNALLDIDRAFVRMAAESEISQAFGNVDNLPDAQALLHRIQHNTSMDPDVREEALARAEALVQDWRVTGYVPPENMNEAIYRYQLAIQNEDDIEQGLLLPYINAELQAQGQQGVSEFRIGDPGVTDLGEIARAGVTVTGLRQAFDQATGQMVYVDLAGNRVDVAGRYFAPVTAEERDARASLMSSLRNPLEDYRADRRNLFAFTDMAKEMADILAEHPAANTVVANIVESITSGSREALTAYGVLRNAFEDEGVTTVRLSMLEERLRQAGTLPAGQSLESYADPAVLRSMLGQDTYDLAEARRRFEAMIVMATFRAGGLEGQSGQAMSNRDFDRLSGFMSAARTEEGFRRSVGSYLRNLRDGVLQREADLRDDPSVNNFVNTYYYNPLTMRSFDDALYERPNTREALNYFLTPERDPAPAPTPTEVPVVEPEQTGAVSTEQGLTPGDVVNAYGNGQAVEVTEALQQAFPSLRGIAVGTIIRRPASN